MSVNCFFFVALGLFAASHAQIMLNHGVTCADKKVVINYHNELRRQVANGTLSGQPKASDMQTLAWDNALQKIAQDWADKMVFQHNANAKDPRFAVGENIYMSIGGSPSDRTFDWKAPLDSWYSENKKYKYGPTGDIEGTGHYTQVVWANTRYVGCGATHFTGKNGANNKFYVCNYGPAGNYDGEYPYKTGSGCEKLCCKEQCKNLYGATCK